MCPIFFDSRHKITLTAQQLRMNSGQILYEAILYTKNWSQSSTVELLVKFNLSANSPAFYIPSLLVFRNVLRTIFCEHLPNLCCTPPLEIFQFYSNLVLGEFFLQSQKQFGPKPLCWAPCLLQTNTCKNSSTLTVLGREPFLRLPGSMYKLESNSDKLR